MLRGVRSPPARFRTPLTPEMLRLLSAIAAAAALTATAPAQTPAAAEQAPPLPQANSAEARALVSACLDKLVAYGRGRFATTEAQDQAMLRNAGLPFGSQETTVDGGWHREVIWAEADGREYVLANGRMLAKVDGDWRLRRGKLSGGLPAPFTFDPSYLVAAWKQLPEAARGVVHVEAAELKGKQCAVLTCKLDGDDALEFADAGAVPDVGGGFGGVVMLGGLGGVAMEPPRPDFETYVAFFVDPAGGDLLRLAVKSYQTDEMMGGVAIQIGGAGGIEQVEEEDEEEEEEAEAGPVQWRRGFPRIKPKKDQSVLTFRVDFRDLGLAEPPSLAPELEALLRAR